MGASTWKQANFGLCSCSNAILCALRLNHLHLSTDDSLAMVTAFLLPNIRFLKELCSLFQVYLHLWAQFHYPVHLRDQGTFQNRRLGQEMTEFLRELNLTSNCSCFKHISSKSKHWVAHSKNQRRLGSKTHCELHNMQFYKQWLFGRV